MRNGFPAFLLAFLFTACAAEPDDTGFVVVADHVRIRGPRACEQPRGSDQVFISGVRLDGDRLVVSVYHGGGCEVHDFDLCWNEFLESYPVQVPLKLGHDAHGDTCKSGYNRDLSFDLAPLRSEYQRAYQIQMGKMTIGVGGKGVLYEF